MSEITHPTIQGWPYNLISFDSYNLVLLVTKISSNVTDGWFREVSEMWPGQAMTLRVKKILHHEKSEYQDVCLIL